MKRIPLLLFITGLQLLTAQSHLLQMDGFFEDWSDISFIEKASNPSSSIDLIEFSASNDEDYLYLRIKVDREILFQQSELRIWIDADNNPNTGQRIREMGSELYYHFGQKRGFILGQQVGHFDIDMVSLPTHSGDEFEIRLRRQGLFSSNTIRIIAAGESFANDALPSSGSLSFTFDAGPFAPYDPVSLAREDPGHIRLMNHNILFDRPLDPAYRPQFERIVRAVNADIFCFNEFFEASAAMVKELMDATLPLDNDTGWFARQLDGDNVTASRYPILQAIRISDVGNMTATLIDLPEDYQTDLLVIVCHFSCCEKEAERQLQVDAVAAFIEEAKKPGGRLTLEEGTPILITGDFNMVGLQQQRTTLLTGDIQNTLQFGTAGMPDWDDTPISDLIPFHTHRPVATTWINPQSGFAPGRLDYMLYTDSRLKAQKSFVLKTDEIPQETLTANGLQAGDTDFSDHLPIVGDFEILGRTTPTLDLASRQNGMVLHPAFPNPMQESIQISFWLPEASPVQVQILSLDGRIIETLIDEVLPSGEHLVHWGNLQLASGMYGYRLITSRGTITRILVK